MKSLYTKILNLIKRGYVSRRIADDKNAALAQVTYLGKTGISEVINPYGLYSNLPENIPVVVFSVQSQEDNRACIGYSQAERFKNLNAGEVVVGNPKTNSFVKFDENGNIEIESNQKINIKSADNVELDVTGDVNLTVTGDVNVDAQQVNLGVGGEPIARLGDQVTVAGNTGTITSAGTNTSI